MSMRTGLRKMLASNEGIVFFVILLCMIAFTAVNPEFFTPGNFFHLARAGITNYVFALGTLLIMICGGIDMSFMAIASLAMYSTIKFVVSFQLQPPMPVIFLSAAALGFLCGLVNAFFVHAIRLPAFIVTLGTQNLFKGFVMVILGTKVFMNLPKNMIAYSRQHIVSSVEADGSVISLTALILPVIGLCLATSLILRYTMLGRSVYAAGGDIVAARRAGFNLARTHMFAYGFAGALAGVGGVLSATLIRSAGPSDLVGKELLVIAAVVLGGGNSTTGKGSVLGAVLGVTLLTMVNNSLTLLRVPSFWQQTLTGLIIILGLLVQAWRQHNAVRTAGGAI